MLATSGDVQPISDTVIGPLDKVESVMAFDTSEPLRGPRRFHELAAAIVAAEVPESHWLEWKSGLDFSTTAGRFAAARTIIAFANRDPLVAARVCGGEGYLVIGVEAGRVSGVDEIDPAELHEKLRTFVDGPHWEVAFVDVSGVRVAVLTVAAPQPGDRIHSLVKTHEGSRSGTVFHRGVGGSAPATHRELAMLQDRLLAQAGQPSPAEEFVAAVGGTNPLLVDRLVRESVKAVVAARSDPVRFPLAFAASGSAEQLGEYLALSQSYELITAPVLEQLIVGCAWPNPAHDRIWADTIAALAQPVPLPHVGAEQGEAGGRPRPLVVAGRDERLEALALLPATMALYGGTIAAVGGGNYAAVRALTTDGSVSWSTQRQRKVTVVEKAAPWETFNREEDLALTVRAGQLFDDTAVLEEKLMLISQRRLRKPRFVCSRYLKEALRPYFAGYDPLRYDELFDETEVLFSLIVADQMLSQHRPYTEPWLGLFVIDAGGVATLEDSRYGSVVTQIAAAGEQWRPLRDGLFDGEARRVQVALDYVTDQVTRLRHQRV